MAPRIFGIEHILYLFVCILLMSLFLILIKKYIHSEKKIKYIN